MEGMHSIRQLLEKQRESIAYFFDAVDPQKIEQIAALLQECRGLIALTGVGKSGLIAQKIAATLTSTGSRACFLSPQEALHGDIGLLTANDTVLALSKSGETLELIQLLPHIKKKGAKIVAVVSQEASRLEQASDAAIVLPVSQELCPFDLAPTISTEVQLLFGDLLAIALMQRKNFSVDDFATNHPAGLLGRKITYKVIDLMLKGEALPICRPDDRLIDVLHELTSKRCGCLLVADEERRLEGIFTDGDLRRAIQGKGSDVLQTKLKELMTFQPRSIHGDKLAIDAIHIMEKDPEKPITVLPVLSDRKIVGLIRMHDILQARI